MKTFSQVVLSSTVEKSLHPVFLLRNTSANACAIAQDYAHEQEIAYIKGEVGTFGPTENSSDNLSLLEW